MTIFHELPLDLLPRESEFADGHYALVHLYNEYPAYYKHSVDVLKEDRPFILDNSIFELGKAFNAHQYATWIEKLSADAGRQFIYVLPDSFHNSKVTLQQAEDFLDKYPGIGLPMIVVQGKDIHERIHCFEEILRKFKNIARIGINFNCNLAGVPNPTMHSLMTGRQHLIETLYSLYKDSDWQLHLLGASLPQEFSFYKDRPYFDRIASVDTSNPILLGKLEAQYPPHGLQTKIETKIIDIIDEKTSESQIACMKYNANWFKNQFK